MYASLRKYIQRLEQEGELRRITAPVSSIEEIAEITDRESKREGGGKALLFEHTERDFPVLTNMMGSRRRMALALGVEDLQQIQDRIRELITQATSPKSGLWDQLRMLPLLGDVAKWFSRKSSGRGACQQVILRDSEASLEALPILKCWPHDGGRFITLPMVNTIDPNSGVRNVGMYRMQILDSHTTGMHWHRHKTGARHYEEYRKRGERMPVSVCLGGDPAYTYAATAPMPDNMDEYMLAGMLRRRPVKLVKCLSNDLWVPADCDFVIEGYVDPNEEKFLEGDFGDHTGFYSLKDLYPKFHVTCITHRRDAIYPATIVGIPPQEDAFISLATEKIFLEPIRLAIAPEVKELHMPVAGTSHNLALISLENSYAAQASKVALSMWGAGQMMFNKYLLLLPQSVHCTDLKAVARAIRSARKENIIRARGVYDVLDHATATCAEGGKFALDLTHCLEERHCLTRNIGSFDCDDRFLEEWNTLIIWKSPKKSLPQREELEGTDLGCILILDEALRDFSKDDILWAALASTEPQRDIYNIGDTLVVDATVKYPHSQHAPARWPNPVCSSPEIQHKVDSRWQEYGIGEFVQSPSAKYLTMSRGESAQFIGWKTTE